MAPTFAVRVSLHRATGEGTGPGELKGQTISIQAASVSPGAGDTGTPLGLEGKALSQRGLVLNLKI